MQCRTRVVLNDFLLDIQVDIQACHFLITSSMLSPIYSRGPYFLNLFQQEKDLIVSVFNFEFCISLQEEQWDENSGFFLHLSFTISNWEWTTPIGP